RARAVRRARWAYPALLHRRFVRARGGGRRPRRRGTLRRARSAVGAAGRRGRGPVVAAERRADRGGLPRHPTGPAAEHLTVGTLDDRNAGRSERWTVRTPVSLDAEGRGASLTA